VSGSPYKFLDSYGLDDRDIFFGRERETEVLLSDVINTRLVVLFAPTGSGKTSLINAGVRPRLEELDYATFPIRVEKDPSESVTRVLAAQGLLTDADTAMPLATQLTTAVERSDKPIVVFFDQFEEFFIYRADLRDANSVDGFIGNIAEIYRDRESGVHTVFSMREEYFVEMDAFRDAIPTIFHNESNLRLRPFDEEQARRAIVLPAERWGVWVDEDLVHSVLADLADHGRIEPARLQIVCDALWDRAPGEHITLGHYRSLGGASKILSNRLVQDVRDLPDEQLELFERLLPELETPFATKYIRGVDELVDKLGIVPNELQSLTDALQKAGLIKESVLHRARYIEWTSDYLAARTEELRAQVRGLVLRRRLELAMLRAPGPPTGLASWLIGDANIGPPLDEQGLTELSTDAALLGGLTRDEAEFVFSSALALGGTFARQWFDVASALGAETWDLLDALVHEAPGAPAAAAAVRLLGDVGGPRAVELLEAAVRAPALEAAAFEAIGQVGGRPPIRLLGRLVDEPPLAARALDTLRRIGTPDAIDAVALAARRDDATACRAGSALWRIVQDPAGGSVRPHAERAWTTLISSDAERLFVVALRHSVETKFWFDRACEQGLDVLEVLRDSVTNPATPFDQAEGAVRLLVELPGEEALMLLKEARDRTGLEVSADKALAARATLARVRSGPAEGPLPVARPAGGLDEGAWRVIRLGIESGTFIPLLGHEINAGSLPMPSEIAQRWISRHGLGTIEPDLAHVTDLLSAEFAWMYPRELLERELRPEAPTGAHRILARLPLPIYITTTYDDLMERALAEEGRSPRRVLPAEPEPTSVGESEPTVESPLVMQVFGNVDEPESLVIGTDDYLDFLSKARSQFRVRILAALVRGNWASLGLGPWSWSWRVARHSILATRPLFRQSLSFAVIDPRDVGSTAPEVVTRMYAQDNILIFWGTPQEFLEETAERFARGGD
jgi:hypothetical protein